MSRIPHAYPVPEQRHFKRLKNRSPTLEHSKYFGLEEPPVEADLLSFALWLAFFPLGYPLRASLFFSLDALSTVRMPQNSSRILQINLQPTRLSKARLIGRFVELSSGVLMLLIKVNAIHEDVLSRTYFHSLRINLSVELSFFFWSMHYLIVKVISIFSFSIRSCQL